MTLTASPNATTAVDEAAFAGIADASRDNWFTTTDHRCLARLMFAFVFIFLLAGLVVGVLVRGELIDAGQTLFKDGDRWFTLPRAFSAHVTLMVGLVVAPIWIALGTLVVPRQVGSARLAFPRLQAFVLWGYVVGGAALITSYVVGDGPPLVNMAGGPLDFAGSGNKATDLLLASLMLLAVVSIAAAVNFVATVITQRRPGLRIDQVRPFTFAMFVTSGITLIATPVHLAGLFLVYLDTHFRSTLFTATGSERVWTHMVWFFGRPEAMLMVLPALGVIGDLVINRTGRALLGGPVAHYLATLFGAATLLVWSADERLATTALLPTGHWTAVALLIPAGLLGLLWLGSLAAGKPTPDASLLFVLGFLLLFGLGLVNIVIAIITKVDGGSAWIVGNSHVLIFGAPLLAAVAAVHEWAPVAWGRRLTQGLTGLCALAVIGGVAVQGLANYILGYRDAPALEVELSDTSWKSLHILSGIGGVLLLAGALLLVLNVIVSVGGRKGPLAMDDGGEAVTAGRAI